MNTIIDRVRESVDEYPLFVPADGNTLGIKNLFDQNDDSHRLTLQARSECAGREAGTD